MIILLLKIFLLSWFINYFEPIQIYFIGVLEGINKFVFKENKFVGIFLKIFTCLKCTSYWSGILLSYFYGYNLIDCFFIGVISSLIGYHYDKINSKIEIRF